jgi:hypothetical protein
MRPDRLLLLSVVALSLPVLAGEVEFRDPAYWPFSSDSPWNTPIGSEAVYVNIESKIFWETCNQRSWRAGTTQDTDNPVFLAKVTDPVRPIYRVMGEGKKKLVVEMPVPEATEPSKTADRHMHIIDPRHEFLVEFLWATKNPDGSFDGSGAFKTDLRGTGIYREYHSSRAYGSSGFAGLIRKGELEHGIRHALALSVVQCNGTKDVWPAVNSDGNQKDGNLFMSSLLAIPPDVDISTIAKLGTPLYEIARALQDYGGYVVDTTGAQALRVDCEMGVGGELNKGWQIGKLTKHLKIVANNSPDSVGGGGKPRRPSAPPLLPVGQTAPEGAVMGIVRPKPPEPVRSTPPVQVAERKKASPQTVSEWDGRLRDRLNAVLAEGRKASFRVPELGGKATALGLDASGILTLQREGGLLAVPWAALSAEAKKDLAMTLASSEQPEDLMLAGFFLLAAGEDQRAESYLGKLSATDAQTVTARFK